MIAQIILETAAELITLGGLYDLFVPRLPPNLAAICGENLQERRLVRELLRALGGSLVAIGVAVSILVAVSPQPMQPLTLIVVLRLVLPSEGINAFCMFRVCSPFYVPLTFAILTLVGALLGWPNLFH